MVMGRCIVTVICITFTCILELHTSGRMLHENWALGKKLRGEEDLLHEKCRKDWRGVALIVETRGGSEVEFMLRRREGGMGRGNWWMLVSPVQVPRKGKGDMEYPGASRSMYVCMYNDVVEHSTHRLTHLAQRYRELTASTRANWAGPY